MIGVGIVSEVEMEEKTKERSLIASEKIIDPTILLHIDTGCKNQNFVFFVLIVKIGSLPCVMRSNAN